MRDPANNSSDDSALSPPDATEAPTEALTETPTNAPTDQVDAPVNDSEATSPPSMSEAPELAHVEPVRTAQSRALYRLSWCMTILGLLLVTVTAVPYLAEELTYRAERGRQRAQVEVAQATLRDLPLNELSLAFQLVSRRVSPSVVHINITEREEEDEEDGAASTSADGKSEEGTNGKRSEDSSPDAKPDSKPDGKSNGKSDGGWSEEFGFPFPSEPRRPRPRRPAPRFMSGQGSGVIVDSDGHIVTNRHVVAESAKIDVVLSDGRHRAARVIGLDELTDIAVLKIDADGLMPAEWGDSDQVDVGALVWAVGSPFGLERSVTSGILSAKHRASVAGTPFQDLMQTDAAVNPGNSGGPLVDTLGRVIGINTAIVGPSYQGVSFAIPSRVAHRVYDDLRTRGEVSHGWLGVELAPVFEDGAGGGAVPAKGARVRRLTPDPPGAVSPARAAGMEPGDIILAWDGKPVGSTGDLIAVVSQTPVGRSVPVRLLRMGQEVTLEVTVGQRPVILR